VTRPSNELNQSILESAPDAIVIVDAQGEIRFSNRQVAALFGYTDAELIGQPVEILLPERFRDRHVGHRAFFGAEMRVRPMGGGLDLYGRRRDGSEFPADISLSPIIGAGETLIAAAIRDVTDRKRVEADLIAAREAADRANEAKSRFLAAASHDLRQPLQTLSMLNGTLRRIVTTPSAAEALDQQGRAISAMSRLLNSLLDVSKLESGAIRPELTDFEVAALFEELRAEFAALAASKGLELRVASCDHSVYSDPSLVGQILKNLVANAIKYTPEGSVQVRCHDDSASVCIEVLDTGVGIAPDHLGRIFDEFYQVGVSPNATRDGYGLGLSIVDRLVRLLGVRLEVQSQPGQGSRFAIALPLGAKAARRGTDAARGTARGQRTTIRRVLLVEDDTGAREATRMLLRVEGFEVAAVSSLEEAIDTTRSLPAPPDLVITDFHLGSGATGLDVIAALRQLTGTPTPAVIVTGDTSTAMKEIPREPGLQIISKPIDADQLLAVARGLAQRAR
jgi:PAS domain S-box-containing protein